MARTEAVEQHLKGKSWVDLFKLSQRTWDIEGHLMGRKFRGEIPADRLATYEQVFIRLSNLRETLMCARQAQTNEIISRSSIYTRL